MALAAVGLGLVDPVPQRFVVHTQLVGHAADRRLGVRLPLQPDRADAARRGTPSMLPSETPSTACPPRSSVAEHSGDLTGVSRVLNLRCASLVIPGMVPTALAVLYVPSMGHRRHGS